MQDLLTVIDVVDEQVERADALLQPALDDLPLMGRDQARDEIERKYALGPLLGIGIDRERDALVQERTIGELAGPRQIGRGQLSEIMRQVPVMRPW